eukprot:7378644-Prymnesium_polylepis.4
MRLQCPTGISGSVGIQTLRSADPSARIYPPYVAHTPPYPPYPPYPLVGHGCGSPRERSERKSQPGVVRCFGSGWSMWLAGRVYGWVGWVWVGMRNKRRMSGYGPCMSRFEPG